MGRSESPSQVFFIVIQWLLSLNKSGSFDESKKIYLAYDNMCNLDRMKVASPFPTSPRQTLDEHGKNH